MRFLEFEELAGTLGGETQLTEKKNVDQEFRVGTEVMDLKTFFPTLRGLEVLCEGRAQAWPSWHRGLEKKAKE